MDLKETQKQLENTYNNNILMKKVFMEILGDEDLQALITNTGVNKDIANKALAFITIYKRLSISTMVAMLFKPTGKYTLDEICHQVELLVQTHLVHFDPDKRQIIVRFELDPQVQADLACFQYPLPIVCEPKILRHNMSSAYFMKRKESVLLNGHKTKDDVDLDHLNLMNQIEFSINETVLSKVKNVWNSSKDETMRQIDRFNRYCKITYDLMLKFGNKFRFSHRYCYRGRTYCEGYYLNYQGNDYCKSLLEFANKETID